MRRGMGVAAMKRRCRRGGGAAGAAPFTGGVPETILGVTPYCRYYGADAGLGGWAAAGYGEDLTYWDHAGPGPTWGVETSYEYAEGISEGVQINGDAGNDGDNYRFATDNTYWSWGTDDFWLKLIYRPDLTNGGSKYIIDKNAWSKGMTISRTATAMSIWCGGGGMGTVEAPLFAHNTWMVWDFIYDNGSNPGTHLYVNGASHTIGNAARGALGDDRALCVGGATVLGNAPCDGTFAFIGVWRAAAGWLASHDQDTLVAAHYAQLTG